MRRIFVSGMKFLAAAMVLSIAAAGRAPAPPPPPAVVVALRFTRCADRRDDPVRYPVEVTALLEHDVVFVFPAS